MSYFKRCFSFLGRLWRAVTGSRSGKRQGLGKRRKGGRGPDVIFDRFAGGKDVFDVNTVTVPEPMLRGGKTADEKRQRWRAFLDKKGVTDGQMTRALFHEYFTEQASQAGPRPNKKGRRGKKRANQ